MQMTLRKMGNAGYVSIEPILGEHSFSSHALNFSHFSQSIGSFGPSSPALSHLEHCEATLSHTLGVTGN
jgi:hypothetical protein